MKINFLCSGGFANIQLEYHTDISELSDDLAQEILSLVEAAGLLEGEFMVQDIPDQSTPDAISYKIQLTQEFHTTEISCSDANAPVEVRPLLARLRRLAIAEKRARAG